MNDEKSHVGTLFVILLLTFVSFPSPAHSAEPSSSDDSSAATTDTGDDAESTSVGFRSFKFGLGSEFAIGIDLFVAPRQTVGADLNVRFPYEYCDYCVGKTRTHVELYWSPKVHSRLLQGGLNLGLAGGGLSRPAPDTYNPPDAHDDPRAELAGPFVGPLIGATGEWTPFPAFGMGLELGAVPGLWNSNLETAGPVADDFRQTRPIFFAYAMLTFHFGSVRAPS